MRENKFNTGLLVGVVITIGVLAIVGLLTLRANAAMRSSSPDAGTSLVSGMPELGEVTFKGIVEQINVDSYVISGLIFRFDMQTMITPGLAPGDLVKVKALLLPDQTRYALSIQLIESKESSIDPEFEFYGIVESTDSAGWVISGEMVQVTAETMIDPGVVVGSLVEVEGRIIEGSLVAGKIHLEDQDRDDDDGSKDKMNEVEFKGLIESINADVYMIAGKTVNTDASTEIKGMPAVGDLVKVHATLQADGGYLAREIEKEDAEDDEADDDKEDADPKLNKVKFKGTLESINGSTWVVAGHSILVGLETKIKGDPQPGDLVEVEAFLQTDGVTYLAHEIEVEDDEMHDQDDRQDSDDRDDSHNGDQDDDDDEDHDDEDHDDDRDDGHDDDHDDEDHEKDHDD
jgi:hypothetical protein